MISLSRAVAPLRRQICWGAEYEPQLNLKLSFGHPSLHLVREPLTAVPDVARPWRAQRRVVIRGAYWLWIADGRWTVTLHDGRTATASTSTHRRTQVLRDLQGERLQRLTADPETGRTTLTFDLGAVLEIRRPSARELHELWLLYLPRGRVVTVRSDGTFSHVGPRYRTERWRSLA